MEEGEIILDSPHFGSHHLLQFGLSLWPCSSPWVATGWQITHGTVLRRRDPHPSGRLPWPWILESPSFSSSDCSQPTLHADLPVTTWYTLPYSPELEALVFHEEKVKQGSPKDLASQPKLWIRQTQDCSVDSFLSMWTWVYYLTLLNLHFLSYE